MTPIEEVPGGIKNKALMQNAAAAKRILRSSVWSSDVEDDQRVANSVLKEEGSCPKLSKGDLAFAAASPLLRPPGLALGHRTRTSTRPHRDPPAAPTQPI